MSAPSMGGPPNALSFTDNIHHLNLHKGLAMWQQKTFHSRHKTHDGSTNAHVHRALVNDESEPTGDSVLSTSA